MPADHDPVDPRVLAHFEENPLIMDGIASYCRAAVAQVRLACPDLTAPAQIYQRAIADAAERFADNCASLQTADDMPDRKRMALFRRLVQARLPEFAGDVLAMDGVHLAAEAGRPVPWEKPKDPEAIPGIEDQAGALAGNTPFMALLRGRCRYHAARALLDHRLRSGANIDAEEFPAVRGAAMIAAARSLAQHGDLINGGGPHLFEVIDLLARHRLRDFMDDTLMHASTRRLAFEMARHGIALLNEGQQPDLHRRGLAERLREVARDLETVHRCGRGVEWMPAEIFALPAAGDIAARTIRLV